MIEKEGHNMKIKNGCVTLRAIEETDSELLYKMMESEKIEKAMGHCTLPINMMQQREWTINFHNTEKEIRLMIELDNGKVIGVVMLFDIDIRNGSGEIGYKIMASRDSRMEGDIKDALDGLLDFGFNNLRLNCIYARVPEGNVPSENLLMKLSFIHEGTLRQRIYQDNRFIDLNSFSITKDEFNSKRGEVKNEL